MPSLTLSLAHRPLRIGLLVRKGVLEDVIHAATASTSLWGGIHNVILPIAEEGDSRAIDTIIRRYRVDVLTALADTQAISRVIDRHEHLRWPNFVGEKSLIQEDQ